MTVSSGPTNQRKYIFCNHCKCETEHVLEGNTSRDYPNFDDGQLSFVERIIYRFWGCLGCKTGLLEECYIFDVTDETYKDEKLWYFKYFPTRNEFQIQTKKFNKLSEKLNNIYTEMLGAFNNNLHVLCALSIRSLIEGICADKRISGQNLKLKIDNMVHILPANIVKNLHSIRFIGNEAAHELSAPSDAELRLAIELCEDLLNFIYELNYKAQNLTAARKKRIKRTLIKAKCESPPPMSHPSPHTLTHPVVLLF